MLDVGGAALLADKGVRTPPKHLYHFTDCGGLIGVLTGKSLWASLATSLNDFAEMIHGVERGRALLGSGTLNVKALPLGQVEIFLDRAKAPKEWATEWRTYVISLCEVADTAMHWLHYGRNGVGVAIGCDAARLEVKPFDLFPIIYDSAEQDAFLRNVIEAIDAALVDALAPVNGSTERDLMVRLAADWTANAVWMAAPRMKNIAFRAEREWRLLTYEPFGPGVPKQMQVPMETFFRPVAGRVVPYKKLKYEALPVGEIILGRSSPMLNDEQALAVLMEESLGSRIPVVRSSVTVRP
jgi:hypothetical protein